jgi:hypothetical protein
MATVIPDAILMLRDRSVWTRGRALAYSLTHLRTYSLN